MGNGGDAFGSASGSPGIPARWTSSAKSGIGTALPASSRVWFTLSHGILNEIYYPRIDQACTRDLGLIIRAEKEKHLEKQQHGKHHDQKRRLMWSPIKLSNIDCMAIGALRPACFASYVAAAC